MSNIKDNFYSLFADRLRSERVRLDLSQAEAGDLCGVSREMWGKYERGYSVPGGEVLFSFAAAGADVQYLLTGISSLNLPNSSQNINQQLYLVKSATEVAARLVPDKDQAAELQNILYAVGCSDSDAVAEAMNSYAHSELSMAEKKLLAAYRHASDLDRTVIERLTDALATQEDKETGDSG